MTGRVVLVESAPGAPGLLSHTAWSVLDAADVVHLRDVEQHPSAVHLRSAGIEVAPVPAGGAPVRDRRDLLGGSGDVADRRLADGLCSAAEEGGRDVVVLLGPDDDRLGRAVGLEAARRHVEVEWVFLAELPPGAEVLRLVEVERALRDPDGGCPWDLEQDHNSLARYLVEETYETLDAIATDDDAALREELGDVLLQVVFHAQIARERRAFGIDDVARDVTEKLVRRHPHVFGDATAADAAAVEASWDQLKQAEKPERVGLFDGVPSAQPALPLAAKLLSRAARAGIAWPAPEPAAAQVAEELDEVHAATTDPERLHEVGDLLHAVVGLATALDVDPELALRGAAERFRIRAEGALELARGRDEDLAAASPQVRAALWEEAAERFG